VLGEVLTLHDHPEGVGPFRKPRPSRAFLTFQGSEVRLGGRRVREAPEESL
jgi:hypothetical protein